MQKGEQIKMTFQGGRRKGAGRPSIGKTKSLKVVLPDEHWDYIDHLIEKENYAGYNDFLRNAVAEKLKLEQLKKETTTNADGSKCTE